MLSRQSRRSMLGWRTSKATGADGNCVEVANGERSVLVRDSRNPSGVMLEFSPVQWSGFMRRIRAGNGISVSL